MKQKGTIKVFIKHKQFYFIESNGVELFAHRDVFTAPGGHMCFFQPGVPVSFEIVKKPGFTAGRAIDVELDAPYELPEQEVSVVTTWLGSYGFAQREACGCEIFVHKRDVLSDLAKYRSEGNQLRVGDRLIHRTVLNKTGNFQAADVDVIAE